MSLRRSIVPLWNTSTMAPPFREFKRWRPASAGVYDALFLPCMEKSGDSGPGRSMTGRPRRGQAASGPLRAGDSQHKTSPSPSGEGLALCCHIGTRVGVTGPGSAGGCVGGSRPGSMGSSSIRPDSSGSDTAGSDPTGSDSTGSDSAGCSGAGLP